MNNMQQKFTFISILVYFKIVIYSCNGKAEFLAAITQFLSDSWYRNIHFNIINYFTVTFNQFNDEYKF